MILTFRNWLQPVKINIEKKKMDANFWLELRVGSASTVIGGILLTLIFFFFKEKLFSLPIVAGVWECEMTFDNTRYNPYKGMKVWYRITLLQSGVSIFGMGEKDREIAAKGVNEYSGVHRRKVDISGCITKRFFGSDEIVIFWREDGEQRETASFFKLQISGCKRRGGLWGTFHTAAAKSNGTTVWKRIA